VKKLFQTLTATLGPSGYEDEVREVIRREVKSLADEIGVDALGNLIVHKRPGRTRGEARGLMVAAHMDETGLMVNHVDDNGFVHFSPIGSVSRRALLGGHVRFLNGAQGVIGFDVRGNPDELPVLDKIYIDVGATSRKDCPVKLGDIAVFERSDLELGNRMVAGFLAGRVSVLVAIETLRNLKSAPHDISFVFTTQRQVGRVGALTSAYGVEPDVAIALDVTPASDAPRPRVAEVALGKGPCIKIQDVAMLSDKRVVDWLIRAAEKKKIPYQRETALTDGTDARAIQRAQAGVPVSCISIPVRYLHSASAMVDSGDVQNAVRLLTAALQTRIEL
jgi:endoglucanase